MKKTIALAFTALLFYTWQDILLWQRIFEAHQLWQFDGIYHAGWVIALYALIAFGALLFASHHQFFNAAVYAALLYTWAHSGLNDILYYLLDGRAVPAELPWLDTPHPFILVHPVTAHSIWLSPFIYLALFVAAYALRRAYTSHRKGA